VRDPSVGTCDEYGVSGIIRFDELAEAHLRIAESHPGFKPLFSLDDLHQTRYTRGMRATGHDDLRVRTSESLLVRPVSRSNLLVCIPCIVNLRLFAERFAVTDLSSQPIVEPLPGAVPAVVRARIQPLATPASGGITTVRAQLDRCPSARGQWSCRSRESREQ
jgi:hypothetical protein